MGTVDKFLESFKYCLDEELNDTEKKEEFDHLTNYFKDNNPEAINDFFESTYKVKVAISNKIVITCLNIIIRLNCPVHIINEQFRTTLLNYVKWQAKTSSVFESISIKAEHIILILVLQIQQFTNYIEADSEDQWKKRIDEETKKAGFKDGFIALFFSMFI